MNKSEFVQAVAEKMPEVSKKVITEALEAFTDTIAETLGNGDSVTFVGFGTFAVRHRAARKGVNPKTGESINIRAANVPSFKAGKSLKEACNLELESVD